MRSYTIFGAGSVGSALAAYLAREGHPVRIVARAPHVRAIEAQSGIRVVTRSETFLAPVTAATALPGDLPEGTVVFLTVQSPDVPEALRTLEPHLARFPLVTWQNGIRAEAAAAAVAPRVFGGVVRCTTTLLEPGEVRLRAPGTLILGRYPEGEDPEVDAIAGDLRRAGFTAAVSPDIRADKALKLLVNLVSGPAVLLRRTGPDPALAAVQAELLREARRVFAAAGVRAEPASGEGQTLDALIAHFEAGGSAPDTSGGIYNSTWQNLHHRRPRLENGFYHGEIVQLGLAHGIPTPVNRRALEVLEAVLRRGDGPEPFDGPAFRSAFAGVIELPPPGDPGREVASGGLEI